MEIYKWSLTVFSTAWFLLPATLVLIPTMKPFIAAVWELITAVLEASVELTVSVPRGVVLLLTRLVVRVGHVGHTFAGQVIGRAFRDI